MGAVLIPETQSEPSLVVDPVPLQFLSSRHPLGSQVPDRSVTIRRPHVNETAWHQDAPKLVKTLRRIADMFDYVMVKHVVKAIVGEG
jgi:hypothetical protein